MKNVSSFVISLMILVALGYLGKKHFFPSEMDRVKKQLASLATMASFQAPLKGMQLPHRLLSLQKATNKEFIVNISEYVGTRKNTSGIQTEYNLQQVLEIAPLYYNYMQSAQVMAGEIKPLGQKVFLVVVMVKGKNFEGK